MNRRFSIMLASLIALPVSLGARSAPPTEAPAGFDTPTLIQNPGSKSSSNGIAEPPGDTFVLDQQIYETLHDVNTGLTGPQDTADKLRTEPLWGLRMRPRFMHDLKSLTLQNAIERHRGEAEHVARRFQRLTEAEKQQLISFLETL
jgi:Di-haem oxidoreductase, putative peroxidase